MDFSHFRRVQWQDFKCQKTTKHWFDFCKTRRKLKSADCSRFRRKEDVALYRKKKKQWRIQLPTIQPYNVEDNGNDPRKAKPQGQVVQIPGCPAALFCPPTVPSTVGFTGLKEKKKTIKIINEKYPTPMSHVFWPVNTVLSANITARGSKNNDVAVSGFVFLCTNNFHTEGVVKLVLMKQDCNKWRIFFRSVLVKWNKSRGTKWVGDKGFIHTHSREQINHKATVTDSIPTSFILAVCIRSLLMCYKNIHAPISGWGTNIHQEDNHQEMFETWTYIQFYPDKLKKTQRNFRDYLISSKTKIRMEQHTTRCVLSKTSWGKDADSKLVTARGFLLVRGKTLDVYLHSMVFRDALQYFILAKAWLTWLAVAGEKLSLSFPVLLMWKCHINHVKLLQ